MNQTQLVAPAPHGPPTAQLRPLTAGAPPADVVPRRTDDFLIRRAVVEDHCRLSAMLDGLSELSLYFRFQTAVGRPPRASVIEPMLRSSGESWVAEHDNHLIAHAMWAWAHGALDTPTAELAAIVADPYQSRGLGMRLLNLAGAHARAAGAQQLLLVVSTANDRTLRLIRRRWPTAPAERDGALINFLIPTDTPPQASAQPWASATTSSTSAPWSATN
ncbi:GNAT family N-acetyltransferase [Kribbella sp. DT2]|uniref:GNAT family N-acetyltransferase n=1 Tax=Kribbella sp. DT2 TaxID=3393427 RepID=UPI003CEE33FB